MFYEKTLIKDNHDEFYAATPIWKEAHDEELNNFIKEYPRELIVVCDRFIYPFTYYFHDFEITKDPGIISTVAIALGWGEEMYDGDIIVNYDELYATRTGYCRCSDEELRNRREKFDSMKEKWEHNRKHDRANVERASFARIGIVNKGKWIGDNME